MQQKGFREAASKTNSLSPQQQRCAGRSFVVRPDLGRRVGVSLRLVVVACTTGVADWLLFRSLTCCRSCEKRGLFCCFH